DRRRARPPPLRGSRRDPDRDRPPLGIVLRPGPQPPHGPAPLPRLVAQGAVAAEERDRRSGRPGHRHAPLSCGRGGLPEGREGPGAADRAGDRLRPPVRPGGRGPPRPLRRGDRLRRRGEPQGPHQAGRAGGPVRPRRLRLPRRLDGRPADLGGRRRDAPGRLPTRRGPARLGLPRAVEGLRGDARGASGADQGPASPSVGEEHPVVRRPDGLAPVLRPRLLAELPDGVRGLLGRRVGRLHPERPARPGVGPQAFAQAEAAVRQRGRADPHRRGHDRRLAGGLGRGGRVPPRAVRRAPGALPGPDHAVFRVSEAEADGRRDLSGGAVHAPDPGRRRGGLGGHLALADGLLDVPLPEPGVRQAIRRADRRERVRREDRRAGVLAFGRRPDPLVRADQRLPLRARLLPLSQQPGRP
ncbi:hypothetical protein HK102_012080, partial [Quaeritorhiza haematococci]